MQFCKDVHGLELLAVGSMKVAFKTCDGQCLKIAMSGNLQESVSILKQCSCECFPKLFAYDKLDMSSALYELCEQCSAKDIANVFGLNPILLERTLNVLAHDRKKIIEKLKQEDLHDNEIFRILDPSIVNLGFKQEDAECIKRFVANVFNCKTEQFRLLQQFLNVKCTYHYAWLDDIRP